MAIGIVRRDRFRKLAHRARGIPGRQFGIRPFRVFITITTSSGTHTGQGTRTAVDTEIVEGSGQPPKVRFLTAEQRVVTDLADRSVEIGPITPDFGLGGTTAATLLGTALTNGQTLRIKLTGPDLDTIYMSQEITLDRAFHYMITASPQGNG